MHTELRQSQGQQGRWLGAGSSMESLHHLQQLRFRQPQKEVNDGQTPDGDKCAVIRTGWVFNQRATSIQQESNKGFQTEKEKSVAEQDLFGLSDSQRRFSPRELHGIELPLVLSCP